MILPDVINKIKLSTCAISHAPIKHEQLFLGNDPGSILKEHYTKVTDVVATAFIIQDGLLLTNRHVVDCIVEDHKKTGNHDHWYAEFGYPKIKGVGWTKATIRIQNIFTFFDHTGSGVHDFGLLSFNHNRLDNGTCKPVEFGNLDEIYVGKSIAVCGYPYGNKWLQNKFGVDRFGPLVHSGIISGVSPYDNINQRQITTFLTDINTAGGMSGSPVFLQSTGQVIGLHYAGEEGTLGCALPVDGERIEGWVRAYNKHFEGDQKNHMFTLNAGGDVIDSPS